MSPQYKVHFPPGQIGTVVFEGGVHEFRGNGLILSVHPLDVGADNVGNTYDANTLTWNGVKDLPDQVRIEPKPHQTESQRVIGYESLTRLGSAFQNEALRFATRIAQNHNSDDPVTIEQVKAFRRNLRNLATVGNAMESGPNRA